MACLNCAIDTFINDATTSWLRSNVTFTTPNGVTLKQTTGGVNPGVSITKGGAHQFFAEVAGSQIHYLNWGTPNNYIAILKATATNRYVTLVNTFDAALALQTILSPGATSAMQGPYINYCKGEGGVIMSIWQGSFALWAADGSVTNALCAGTLMHPAQVYAVATATTLEIHNGTAIIASCIKPVGKVTVLPSSTISFSDVIIGSGASTQTKQGKIRNSGNNCLTITGVSDNAPFSIAAGSYSKTMPATLLPNDELTFNILFHPLSTVGSPFNKDLIINPAPHAGDLVIHCKGAARSH